MSLRAPSGSRKRLPTSVQLPTRRVVALKGWLDAPPAPPAPPAAGEHLALFSHAIDLVDSATVTLSAEGSLIDVRSLDLRDFHALRAILTNLGWLTEEAVSVTCRNCDRAIEHWPCASLELGPFVDRELSHPALDTTLDVSVPHPIPGVGARGAREIVLRHPRHDPRRPLTAHMKPASARARAPQRGGPQCSKASALSTLSVD